MPSRYRNPNIKFGQVMGFHTNNSMVKIPWRQDPVIRKTLLDVRVTDGRIFLHGELIAVFIYGFESGDFMITNLIIKRDDLADLVIWKLEELAIDLKISRIMFRDKITLPRGINNWQGFGYVNELMYWVKDLTNLE